MDKQNLLNELIKTYREKHSKSKAFYDQACKSQILGGSHNLRLFAPFPFYDVQCQGSKVTDMDGNTYIDFWQGHFANILGHNPSIIIDALVDYYNKGQGLTTGFPGNISQDLYQNRQRSRK